MRSHSLPNQERDRSFSLSLQMERTARKSLGILESEWLKLKSDRVRKSNAKWVAVQFV
ncbi:hypothetical protein [Coleofasciculus sp. FACHB-SPT9]|uniref:hypothetical protein n=1 Tax=Cyanophyceae TaxID=3028117 RepID=UPI00168925C9|nr:hypothetical protein [Coleofasciculus sp. FACHB-SPT9]MBD1889992.1 hypothetical protein [Coleofasciculus sp. FACHB-SPT9]